MKIIDQTPLLDAKGQLSLINRVQGMLKYGFSWPAGLEAQTKVIRQMDKVLEKGYTLIRNQQLGASEIIVPLILVGPSGIYVMEATPLKGLYRARGEELGTITNGKFQPAAINIISRTLQLSKALQVFFDRQGIKLSAPVEPVLLAADPGLHIESVRPAVRILMSDAIDRFAASLLTGRPVYKTMEVTEFVERIQNPRPAGQAQKPAEPQEDIFAMKENPPSTAAESSRMQSILKSPQSDKLIEKSQSDVDFAFDEEPSPTVLVSNPAPRKSGRPQSAAPSKRVFLGMTLKQILLLGGLAIAEFCVVAAAVIIIYINSRP
jgi:hypothetical protein